MYEERLLSKDLINLQSAMLDLPPKWRRHLLPSLDALVDASARKQKIMHLIQENLEKIRLDMKYLMFDLQCTRQERDELKS